MGGIYADCLQHSNSSAIQDSHNSHELSRQDSQMEKLIDMENEDEDEGFRMSRIKDADINDLVASRFNTSLNGESQDASFRS